MKASTPFKAIESAHKITKQTNLINLSGLRVFANMASNEKAEVCDGRINCKKTKRWQPMEMDLELNSN
jgi:hypothetical protein